MYRIHDHRQSQADRVSLTNNTYKINTSYKAHLYSLMSKEYHVLNPYPEPQLKGYVPSHNSRNTNNPTFKAPLEAL